jgi:hypothetical protein
MELFTLLAGGDQTVPMGAWWADRQAANILATSLLVFSRVHTPRYPVKIKKAMKQKKRVARELGIRIFTKIRVCRMQPFMPQFR